jgi:hypothetical protein
MPRSVRIARGASGSISSLRCARHRRRVCRTGRRAGFARGPRDDQAAIRSRNSAPAAPSPTPAAATATSAAAAAAATPAAATATTATADPGYLLSGGAALLVEQMECGEADVGHLLFAENEALPGPGHMAVSLRDIRGRQRRCECRSRQRKPKSSGKSGSAQRRRGSGFARAVLSPSLLNPCHVRFLPYVSIQVDGDGQARTAYECEAAQPVPICESFFSSIRLQAAQRRCLAVRAGESDLRNRPIIWEWCSCR